MPYEKFVGETRKSGIVNSRTSLQSLLQDTKLQDTIGNDTSMS